ncbi:hypothetical protein PI95_009395 [Hassallia byssoidea VB512170]|uniref:Uncharacterized protein n=1 Tax=Hassallia byssoidea VB512170 TaxID=1304833 RepID=A0A846H666_9CYAN|nr:hypothetical protein [Hassalia byssoidea]NEU72775.1 hypothetical protein [Hassalia byssoidea VB512170]
MGSGKWRMLILYFLLPPRAKTPGYSYICLSPIYLGDRLSFSLSFSFFVPGSAD